MKKIILSMLCLVLAMPEKNQEFSEQQIEELKQNIIREAQKEMFKVLLESAKKIDYNQINRAREEYLSNLSSTAPGQTFIANADISSELAENSEDFSGNVYVSTDNQSTWISESNFALIGTEGYENTWGVNTSTTGGNNLDWYLGGVVNSTALGLDYGTLVISQSPNNVNQVFPPSLNLSATIIEDLADASANQDILKVSGTYSKSFTSDAIDKIYLSMDLSGECCEAGDLGLFGGELYLYGVGIVNPDNPETIYAVGYVENDLSPVSSGLLKLENADLTGDDISLDGLPTQVTDNIQLNQNGNTLNTGFSANDLFQEAGFGDWPNSLNGLVLLGVTIRAEAGWFGSDLTFAAVDQTDPGVLILGSQHQEGNAAPILSSPEFNEETNTLSVTYTDSDGNLALDKKANFIQNGEVLAELSMIPDSHTYQEGVVFSVNLDSFESGNYDVEFLFSDGDSSSSFSSLQYNVTIGSSACPLLGDINQTGEQNVQDIILLVQLILNTQYEPCGDMNEDGVVNIQDVILLVNAILDI